jgi:hypothetical protein
MNPKIDAAIKEGLRLRDLKVNKSNNKLIKDLPRVQKWADKYLYKLITKAVYNGDDSIILSSSLRFKFSFIDEKSMTYGLNLIPGIKVYKVYGYSSWYLVLKWEI